MVAGSLFTLFVLSIFGTLLHIDATLPHALPGEVSINMLQMLMCFTSVAQMKIL
jgi:hypothetical protein